MLAFCVALSSCASLLPVNHQYEKAGTLGKGGVELSGHVTKYDVSHFGRTETSNKNYGLRAGYGVSDRFDLKMRYERMAFSSNFDNRLRDADYFSLVPKFALIPRQLSVMMPLSVYIARDTAEGKEFRRTVKSIAPQAVVSFTNRTNKFDLSFMPKMDFLVEDGYNSQSDFFVGMSVGAGFSADLDRWAIRPEIGYSSNGQKARYLSYGIGVQIFLRKKP